jgi:hypothetical protein
MIFGYHHIKDVNVLKEDEMISSAFLAFSNLKGSRRRSRVAASQPPRARAAWLTIAASHHSYSWIPCRALSRAVALQPPNFPFLQPTRAAFGHDVYP